MRFTGFLRKRKKFKLNVTIESCIYIKERLKCKISFYYAEYGTLENEMEKMSFSTRT